MAGRRALVALAVVAVLTAGCASPGGQQDGPGADTAAPTGLSAPDGSAGVDAESDAQPDDDTGADGGSEDGSDAGTGADVDPGTTATGDDVATDTRAAGEVPPPEVDVLLNCTLLRVTVTPEAWHYRLYLRYRDTATGQQRRIAAGVFSGTVTDHFGRTDLVLVTVEVRVAGFGPVLRTRPTRCAE